MELPQTAVQPCCYTLLTATRCPKLQSNLVVTPYWQQHAAPSCSPTLLLHLTDSNTLPQTADQPCCYTLLTATRCPKLQSNLVVTPYWQQHVTPNCSPTLLLHQTDSNTLRSGQPIRNTGSGTPTCYTVTKEELLAPHWEYTQVIYTCETFSGWAWAVCKILHLHSAIQGRMWAAFDYAPDKGCEWLALHLMVCWKCERPKACDL